MMINKYNQTKYFFMEIINTFKQSIAKEPTICILPVSETERQTQ